MVFMRGNSEETKVIKNEVSNDVLTAFNAIPYSLINDEIDGSTQDALQEFTEIASYYKIYKKGADFTTEGTNGDYVGANLKYKMASSLINKEARFLFSSTPDISIDVKGDLSEMTEEVQNSLTVINDLVLTVLDKNNFEQALIKAAKDCFIGKRIAGLVNFNDEGITVNFLPSTQFIYETKTNDFNTLTKFVAFIVIKDSNVLSNKLIFKKKFVLENDGFVWLEESIYNGSGALVENVTEYQPTKLKSIPAVIFINDGLTGDTKGESEIDLLENYEAWNSKLSNADIDAGRKSMNPTKYTVDMDSRSTQNLSTAAGAFWDLGSDQNLDNPSPQVGMLEPSMSYSSALGATLDRIKTTAYEQIDMPNITLESMQGAITSGKTLKALYWPLLTRCKEKFKMWGPQLQNLIDILIQGAFIYPKSTEKYINDPLVPVAYEISVEYVTPLQDDEIEEKNMDLSEVEAQVMSRKSYMKKWRGLTDNEVQDELEQIALERQILEDSTFGGMAGGMGEEMPMEEEMPTEGEEGMEEAGQELSEEESTMWNGILDELDSIMAEME